MDKATMDMFMRIETMRRKGKAKAHCPDCDRIIAKFKSGKFYPHNCKDD